MYKDVIQTIKSTINEHDMIPQNSHVVIGLSGGPDSTCLFHVLLKLRTQYNFEMTAVHVNHLFRPGDAEKDQKYTENICKENQIDLHTVTIDVNKAAVEYGETPEEAGRRIRYETYDNVASEISLKTNNRNKVLIAVAQNKDDQVETVLMRIIRGTGINGLSGIPYKRQSEGGFDIIRPLLDTFKKDVITYCKDNRLNPCVDKTNFEPVYQRNKIRLDLLPVIKSDFNHNVEDAIVRLSDIAKEENEYFDEIIQCFIEQNCELIFESKNHDNININMPTKIKIKLSSIRKLHKAIRHRLILDLFEIIGLTQDMELVHIKAVDDLIEKGETGKTINLPRGYEFEISYDKAELYKRVGENQTEDNNYNIEIFLEDICSAPKCEIDIELPRGSMQFSVSDKNNQVEDNGENHLTISLDEFKSTDKPLTVRTRSPGDRIKLKGMNGSKKLQDLFVDLKIERAERDRIPLLVAGNDVLWVVGIRKSRLYPASTDSQMVLNIDWKPRI